MDACLSTQGPSDCGKSFVLYLPGEICKVYKPPGPAGAPGYPPSQLVGREPRSHPGSRQYYWPMAGSGACTRLALAAIGGTLCATGAIG